MPEQKHKTKGNRTKHKLHMKKKALKSHEAWHKVIQKGHLEGSSYQTKRLLRNMLNQIKLLWIHETFINYICGIVITIEKHKYEWSKRKDHRNKAIGIINAI